MLEAFLVFAAMFALDFVWARYNIACAKEHPVTAGGWASMIIVLSGVAQILYINNIKLLIPAAAGAFVGTYAAVRKWK